MSVYLLQGCGLCSHCPVHSAAFTIQMECRHCVSSPVGEMWDHSLYLKIDDLFIDASALIVILTLTEAAYGYPMQPYIISLRAIIEAAIHSPHVASLR